MRIAPISAVMLTIVLSVSLAAQTVPVADQVDPARVYGNMIRTAERDIVSLADAMPENKYGFAPSADYFRSGASTEFKGVRTFASRSLMLPHRTTSICKRWGSRRTRMLPQSRS